jgi:hypothetical protein
MLFVVVFLLSEKVHVFVFFVILLLQYINLSWVHRELLKRTVSNLDFATRMRVVFVHMLLLLKRGEAKEICASAEMAMLLF